MGSRIGSIAILLVIGAIVVAVIVVINQLDLLSTGEPDGPVMVVSIEEDELVLINEPQSITVTISSGNPIASLELLVDGVKVADVAPPYSQDRGAWIGAFVWTPQQLGYKNLQIGALDSDGVETVRTIRVEVTDDQARVAAALKITVLGITPLQQFPAGTKILIAMSATGSAPIERFEMQVNGAFIAAVTPKFDQATDRYAANIEWTPDETGELDVTITAVDEAGRSESRTIPVILVPQGDTTDPTESADERQDTPSESQSTADDTTDNAIGVARIDSPDDGEQYQYDSDFDLDVDLVANNVATVESALLYITPIAPDNTLGNSVLIHSSEGHAAGDYRERVVDVERFITGSGSYELQLVIFTPEEHRYDHRITIHVVAVAASDSDADQDQESEPDSDNDEIDLAIVTARQSEDDRRRLNVSVTNESTVDIERTVVLVTVVDASTGAELAATAVTLNIEGGDLRTIPLDLELQPGQDTDALVVIESEIDTDTSNNTFDVSLVGPEPEVVEDDPPADEEEETLEQEEEQEQETLQQEEEDAGSEQDDPEAQQAQQEQQAVAAPDLAFLDIQATSDGYVLLTVINNGDAPAATFSIVISASDGQQLEVISRRAADSDPLSAGGTEILTSLQPHSGMVTISVQLGGDQSEANLSDNTRTLEIE